MKKLGRYWGYILLLFIFGGWITKDVGPSVLAVASIAATIYFLFQAPVWCCARNRNGLYCRNNSSGLLVGCYKRQHKWQTMQLLLHIPQWREMFRGMWRNPVQRVATMSMFATTVSALAAVVGVVSS